MPEEITLADELRIFTNPLVIDSYIDRFGNFVIVHGNFGKSKKVEINEDGWYDGSLVHFPRNKVNHIRYSRGELDV